MYDIMRKTILLITAAAFIVWILPLGSFIGSGQEKLMCSGKRALCMCSNLSGKNSDARTVTALHGSGLEPKEKSNPSSGTQDMMLAYENFRACEMLSVPFNSYGIPLFSLIIRPIEHVPKM